MITPKFVTFTDGYTLRGETGIEDWYSLLGFGQEKGTKEFGKDLDEHSVVRERSFGEKHSLCGKV